MLWRLPRPAVIHLFERHIMYASLSTGPLGIQVELDEAAGMAARYGFEGLHLSMQQVLDFGVQRAKDLLQRHGLRPAMFGMGVQPSLPEADFGSKLTQLKLQASAAAELGCDRCSTWIPPASDELDFQANYELHRKRLAEVAELLKLHGVRLGLEFIGPKTCRDGRAHPFIHTMDGMLELCRDIGTGNVGLLLDCWHWHTSGGTAEDLARLTNADVVDVHINDAPAGVPMDELHDTTRAMPGETGVIDIAAFLQGLDRAGYDGPIAVEPFSQRILDLPPEERLRETREAVDKVWRVARLA